MPHHARYGLTLLLLAWHGIFGAERAAAERLAISSATYANFRFLSGYDPTGTPTTVSADLRFPGTNKDRYPVVVIGHTIGGWKEESEGYFASELRKAGYATLSYDSFKPRHFGDVARRVEPRATPSAIADAFAALKLLAAHPKIDPKRISIAGFSFGGDIAHITSFERTRAVMSREHRFAAHIAFYPGWTFGAPPGAAAYSGAPVLLLFAEHDELTPPSKVKQYLDFLEIYGTKAPLEIITYAGAYHAWANPRLKPTKYYPQHTSMRKCPMILIHAGRANILTEHGEMSMDRALLEKCRAVGRGYTMGFNAQIRAKSIADTIAFLRKHLGE